MERQPQPEVDESLYRAQPKLKLGVYKPRTEDIRTKNHYWQVVNSSRNIFLYSAYFDDRSELRENLIRIMAIGEVTLEKLHCLLWYPRQRDPDVSMIKRDPIGPKIAPSGDTKYEQYLFSCGIVAGKGVPDFVSVTSSERINSTASTLMRVLIPERPHRKFEFGHCMSVVYWKHDPYKVVEWLELHRMWGVGEVTVYNNSLDDVTAMIFKQYARKGFVDFRQAPSVLDDDGELVILMNMSPVINDCLYRNMYRYRWIICSDLDEYIVPTRHRGYHGMLRGINSQHGFSHPAYSYMFNNVYFFTDLGAQSREPWFLMTQRFIRHVQPSPFGYSVKSITDPLACVGLQNHLCWRRMPSLEGMARDWNVDVNITIGANFHYKKCHLDHYEGEFGLCQDAMQASVVNTTMRRFGDRLYDRVAKVLLELNMIEEVSHNTSSHDM